MSEYDVVVIGGGSAGCAAAGVLCRHSNLRVCLIEAGPDYGAQARGRWPAELLDPRRRPETHDWGYLEQRADAARSRSAGPGCSEGAQPIISVLLSGDHARTSTVGQPQAMRRGGLMRSRR